MELRLSPSGPIVASIGQGFILETSFSNANINPFYFVPTDVAPIELKEDPSTGAAPFARPEISNFETDKEYVVVANIATKKSDSFTTAVLNIFLDYSTNGGNTWTTLSHARYTSPGGAGAMRGENNQFQVETAPILGSNITGAVQYGSLMVRARWGQVGGVNESMTFEGTSVVGSVGGFNLKLIKQLPAGS